MSDNLHLLFSQIADGDEDAFKQVFEAWYDPLFSTALAYLKVPEIASDVCQQVFLKIWERRAILKAVEDPKSWLFTTARYQAFNMLKDGARRDKHEEIIRNKTEGTALTPEEEAMRAETEKIIHFSLQRLTDKQREAFVLNRYEGLSFRQIAEQWGVRTDTIKEHVTKAAKEIKHYLATRKDDLIIVIVILVHFFL